MLRGLPALLQLVSTLMKTGTTQLRLVLRANAAISSRAFVIFRRGVGQTSGETGEAEIHQHVRAAENVWVPASHAMLIQQLERAPEMLTAPALGAVERPPPALSDRAPVRPPRQTAATWQVGVGRDVPLFSTRLLSVSLMAAAVSHSPLRPWPEMDCAVDAPPSPRQTNIENTEYASQHGKGQVGRCRPKGEPNRQQRSGLPSHEHDIWLMMRRGMGFSLTIDPKSRLHPDGRSWS